MARAQSRFVCQSCGASVLRWEGQCRTCGDWNTLVETVVPSELVGLTVADARVREKHHVTVVCVKPVGSTFTYATVDTVFRAGDLLVVAGETAAAEAFARLQ